MIKYIYNIAILIFLLAVSCNKNRDIINKADLLNHYKAEEYSLKSEAVAFLI